MVQRVVYGGASILLILIVFLLDVSIAESRTGLDGPLNELLARGSVLPLFVLVVVLAGAVELKRLLVASGSKPFAVFAYFMIAVVVLTPWLSAAGWLGLGPAQVEGLHWQIVWLILACVGTGALCVKRGTVDGTVRDVGATAILIGYLGFLPSFALQLRCGRDIPEQEGAAFLLMTILVVKASDIAAYFVGSTMGRHKLIETISPNKSIEGAIGGVFGSVAVAIGFAYSGSIIAVLSSWGSVSRSVDTLHFFGTTNSSGQLSPLLRACLFGVAMSILGQIGDLLESCFKRDAEIKDSGRILPTFGGILDLIDSPVLALPVAWFLLTAIWRVV